MAGRADPVRTCVGCRARAPKAELVRVVVVEDNGVRAVVPDPRGRRPGRGASLHPDPGCLDLAVRRRALPRAFRLAEPLDTSAVRRWIEARAGRHHEPPGSTSGAPSKITRSGKQVEKR